MTPAEFLAARLEESIAAADLIPRDEYGVEHPYALWQKREHTMKQKALTALQSITNPNGRESQIINTIIRAMCAVWDDHPDFDESWRV